MDGIILLAALAVLAVPVAIVLLFVRVARLNSQLRDLEARLASQDAAAPVTVQPPESLGIVAPPEAPPATAERVASGLPAPSPWERAKPAPAKPLAPPPPLAATTDQNRPLVVRADRLATLARWLRDNWVYAVSAVSLGLAGIFFVQYGVERGLLPPAARVLGALVFGAGLVGAGEWLRRRHGDEGAGPTAMLPSVFSGAGIVTLFAAVLAARQLYGLIGPQMAFAGHLATAALAVAIGWFSGPLLVAVGLIGAFASPFIVGGSTENLDWLYGYFALLSAVGLGVDAVRRWAWVSVLALLLGYGGGFLIQLDAGSDAGWAVQLVALVVLSLTLPELRIIPAQSAPAALPALLTRGKLGWPVFPVRLALGATLAACVGLWCLSTGPAETAMLAMAALTALALAFLLWADKAEGLADMAFWPTATLLVSLVTLGQARAALWHDHAAQALALRGPETAPSLVASILLAMAALVSLAAAWRALRPGPWGVPFALAAALAAPLAAVALEIWWQPALVLGPYGWALHVIALAAGMVGFALRLARTDAPEMRRTAHATLSALALIALALFILTTKTALTLALAVLVVVAAALDRRFRLPEMSLFLQAGAAVLGYRLLVDPGLDWALAAPLVQVLLAFGGAIAAMLAALWLQRGMERPMARAVAESAAAGLAAILANVLVTRWLDALPEPVSTASYAPQTPAMATHWGLTLNALSWLVFALMQLWRARLPGPLQKLRLVLAILGGLLAALGLTLAATLGNPLFSWSAEDAGSLVKGPLVLDTLALAYAVPGGLLLAVAWRLPGVGRRLRLGLVVAGAAFTALYTGLEIRRFWQGDWLGAPTVPQEELYSYTLALMLLGAGLLYQAIARRSDGLRRLAMAVIGVTVAKVFLIDAAGLTGLTRVVSFAGLGLSLAGLAWLNRWVGRRP
ncbi:DUF2339 domain-containing protein [Tabrizicola oligotrophica]|uniref:DUF2339 domain-containing protein n=1 Tax=Tabrizicola oligotrophica TaxID=2710650 RepID=A0A6M0QU50_9RHOB|nr:DUF2339 domain-containing protein [Tabrizicola oligotrophica]NEY90959.1 DUF2339 domain-containing protein [Tabrizicola oligotrophica]